MLRARAAQSGRSRSALSPAVTRLSGVLPPHGASRCILEMLRTSRARTRARSRARQQSEDPMRLLLVATALVVAGLAPPGTAGAQTVTHNSVTLNWTTPGDDSLTGTAAQFDLRYSTAAITATNFSA